MAPMATTEHYTKDDRGRWVVQFGRHRGKRLDQIPSPYLRWMLREVQFVVGNFRRAVGRGPRGQVAVASSRADESARAGGRTGPSGLVAWVESASGAPSGPPRLGRQEL